MSMLTEDQAMGYMHKLLGAMVQAGGSDLFISVGSPPTMKAHGTLTPCPSRSSTRTSPASWRVRS